jgi:quinoprotein glucose dehydrogenase
MGHPSGLRSFLSCPSGATNITDPPSADPETGVLYVSTSRACRSERLVPAREIDQPDDIMTTGTTLSDFAVLDRGDFRGPQGLSIYDPPWGKITAIDMNTGEHRWWIPNGETPDRFRNNPLLQGIDIGNTGSQTDATVLVTRSLLMWAEGRGGRPVWYAADKQTGERVGEVELPAPSSTAPMTYQHEGVQYIVVPIAGGGVPGSLVALRLPQ